MSQERRRRYGRAALALTGTLFALVCAGMAWADSGGVQEMTLEYTGTRIDARVTVFQTTQGNSIDKTQTVIYDSVVQPGESFTIFGADRNGTLGPVVRIRVDGKMNASIVVNCSQPVEPGMSAGDFMIVDVISECDGEDDPGEGEDPDDPADGEDDPDDGEDDEEPDCDECDGQVTELTFFYVGEEEVEVRVEQKVRRSNQVIFEDLVGPGEPFTVTGASRHGTMGSKILIYTDDNFRGSLHTSCSEPIGPGLVFRDFELLEGESRNGGRLCPLEDGEGDGNDETGCDECDGQVIELTLRYNGEEEAHIEVVHRLRSGNITIYDGLVEPDEPFTFFGQWRGGRMGAWIRVYVDGDLAARIHTSCSEPIGPGLVVGDFEVVDGSSRNGGRLCALPADDP